MSNLVFMWGRFLFLDSPPVADSRMTASHSKCRGGVYLPAIVCLRLTQARRAGPRPEDLRQSEQTSDPDHGYLLIYNPSA